MLTYTSQRNLYGSLTGDTSSANLALGDTLINADTRRLLRKLGNRGIERVVTDTTVASQQNYPLPARMKKLKAVTITAGTTLYPIIESPSMDHWRKINSSTSYTSNVPEWFKIINNQIYFWPIPSTASQTITYTIEISQKDLSIADYTTGAIYTATQGSTLVVGTATTWTSIMAGRYLQIATGGNAGGGDNEFYEISSVSGATAIVLVPEYAGASISTGSAAYIVGEVSMIPDGFHECPVFRATATYFAKIDEARSNYFKGLADDLEKQLVGDAGSETTSVAIADTTTEEVVNPNLQVTL